MPATTPLTKPTACDADDFLVLAKMGGWHLDVASSRLLLSSHAARILGVDDGGTETVRLSREVLHERIHKEDRSEVMARWSAALSGHPYEARYRLNTVSGEPLWIWERAHFTFDASAQLLSVVGVVQDVTEHLVRVNEQANVDALTGLPNRRFLAEHLDVLIPLARRNELQLAVLFIDLDHFKQVNDVLGHAMGDLLLREVAARMRSCLRESDLVARHGGDEFIVVLPGILGESDAGLIALKLIEVLTKPYDLDGHAAHVGASIGITLFPANGVDPAVLLSQADMAMYRAKSAGRATLCFFEPEMMAVARERQTMDVEMRRALVNREYELHYQPIYDMGSRRRMHAVEALIRWNHPQRGLVGPDYFIPAAEESGLIRDIGRWVVQEACLQMSRWQDKSFFVSINVSSMQIPKGLSLEWLRETIRQSDVDPGRLIFEITESALLQDNQETHRWLSEVERLGVRLSVDDFGTGYASIGFLRAFCLQQLKIDRSFVRDMLRDEKQRDMVKSIVGIARNMGMTVTAEGVEDAETLSALKALGCDFAQGFHLSHPLPAQELSGHFLFPTGPAPEAAASAVAAGFQ